MASDHKRNTGPMLDSPRCGARTRLGQSCRSPAVHGKKRCRMHGGAAGSGAPIGNQNALKEGSYTGEAIELRRARAHLKRCVRAWAKTPEGKQELRTRRKEARARVRFLQKHGLFGRFDSVELLEVLENAGRNIPLSVNQRLRDT